jgi:phosphoesterase RecJ-like protein
MNNKVIAKIKKSENILLLTHENPDGDALGSILALSMSLKKINKKINAVCTDDIPTPFLFLPNISEVKKDFLLGDYDLVIILDCGDLKRTGFADRLKEFSLHKRKIINIDHHPKNDLHRISAINMIDYHASSTSEIIYRLITEMKIEIDSDISTCLLCGLYTDTGAFRHSNTTPTVLEISSILLKHGGRLKKISENISNGKTISALKLWGVAFSRIQKNEKLGLVSSFVTQKDIENCSATLNDLAGVVNMINSIPSTNAAILFSETEDGKIKASLRTESDKVDVSRLAKVFGGGGLKKASGFTIDGRLVEKNGKWMIV